MSSAAESNPRRSRPGRHDDDLSSASTSATNSTTAAARAFSPIAPLITTGSTPDAVRRSAIPATEQTAASTRCNDAPSRQLHSHPHG